MNRKQPFQQAVKAFYREKKLSAEQLEKMQQLLQQKDTGANTQPGGKYKDKKKALLWGLPVIFCVFVLGNFIFPVITTPKVIQAAYADISKDSELHNGMDVSMRHWLDENAVASVPQQYAVEMSKFCVLDRYLTTHLRIAGTEQGKLHLFFHQGKGLGGWKSRSGVLQRMNWRLLEVHKDLTLIVMYTHDMRESAVEQILGELLPHLQV